jgi:hypothetical protein
MIRPIHVIAIVTAISCSAELDPLRSQSRNPADERSIDIALFEAAKAGDLTSIGALLRAGANVNAALPGDGSPLIAGAGGGHLEAVRLLLDRGADPNLPVLNDGNALIAAARNGHSEVVALLLERGARINDIVPMDETALIQACASGHLNVVRLLVNRGADVNLAAYSGGPNGEWRTPLKMARRGNYADVVALLLAAGARD